MEYENIRLLFNVKPLPSVGADTWWQFVPLHASLVFIPSVLCSLTLPCAGKEFGINNYSTVSSVVQRIKNRSEKDKYLQREVDDVRIKVLKSQKRT